MKLRRRREHQRAKQAPLGPSHLRLRVLAVAQILASGGYSLLDRRGAAVEDPAAPATKAERVTEALVTGGYSLLDAPRP
jgi:hypothetical protein